LGIKNKIASLTDTEPLEISFTWIFSSKIFVNFILHKIILRLPLTR